MQPSFELMLEKIELVGTGKTEFEFKEKPMKKSLFRLFSVSGLWWQKKLEVLLPETFLNVQSFPLTHSWKKSNLQSLNIKSSKMNQADFKSNIFSDYQDSGSWICGINRILL